MLSFGKQVDTQCFKGSTMVLPSSAVGLCPHIAMDLYILNQGMVKLGYYVSDYMSPLIINDIMKLSSEGPGKITMPCEIWQSPDNKTTLMVMRSGTESGKSR
jgi:predicted ATP-grasp superfamily ATP-dependent carboligase